MGRKMASIKTKYELGGSFKPVIKMPIVSGNFTLIEVDYKEELSNVIIQNFNLEKIEGDYMYEALGECTKIIKVNKKYSIFNHEA